ncbi:hypothetical protein KFL_009480030 [Klebsormidium nitens]|uniref:Nucleotide-diphospho-sugar transferase domain-containing protein n=1 Tax=Klebsormidium nitens TaxID=105231 RepID=A0A1Y1ITS2_KLENI|nr:hypothetical protein KFL_009480030 [Klebsormidium nitens]|eukprot:GAQ92216.1 hypothetical protein KFL_009480030 [Klebsormidium nitens]
MHACRGVLGPGKAAITSVPTVACVFLLLWWSNSLQSLKLTTHSLMSTMQQMVYETPESAAVQEHVITWENIDSVLGNISNDHRELIITTISGQYEDEDVERRYGMTAWNLNWVGHLRRQNISNFLIVGTDELACEMTREVGIPCYEDELGWMPDAKFYRGRQVGLKWFYLQQIVARGYHPIFLDNDAVVLQDPFQHWDRAFDIQGLYDMNGGLEPAEVSDYHNESGAICPLVTLGDYFTNWPCMSTGVMFVRATRASYAAISAMVFHLSRQPGFWEQAMWQTEVLPFLSADERRRRFVFPPRRALLDAPPPRERRRKLAGLKFRLLPLEKFHNVNTLRARRRLGLPVDSVIVHCGYIHGLDKIIHLRALRLWLLPIDSTLYTRTQKHK